MTGPRADRADHGPADRVSTVTGAFSYSGAAIAHRLLDAGHHVRTLTGHPERAPAGTSIEVHPLRFDDPRSLANSLRGTHTLYNTYWVRFAHGDLDHEVAVANSRVLFEAARAAGVARIVHVSIMRPDLASPYAYFRGKAQVERCLAQCGVSHAIVRPAILFGGDGVLVNNVAWLLRHLPVFAVGGRGDYRIRGIHVDDLAALCVRVGSAETATITDAVGPQRLTFLEFVRAIKAAVGAHSVLVPVPGRLLTAVSAGLSALLRDTLLTRDEYWAMVDGLADSDAPATGTVVFTDWLYTQADTLGRRYANELDRHFRPSRPGHRSGGRP